MSSPNDQDLMTQHFEEATQQAFAAAIAQGLPVFYYDWDNGLDILQQGRQRWEIRWLPGQPAGHNFEKIRELPPATDEDF